MLKVFELKKDLKKEFIKGKKKYKTIVQNLYRSFKVTYF